MAPWQTAGLFGLAAAVGAVIVVGYVAGGERRARPDPAPAAPPAAAAPREAPTPEDKAAAAIVAARNAPTMADALRLAQPMMGDSMDAMNGGAVLFTVWANAHMRWADVGVAQDETSYALARKDSDVARGKRVCVPGQLVEIETVKDDAIGKFFVGTTMSSAGNLFHFYAVRSTGALVANSYGRICGVVTGLYDYANSGGGTSHAVQIVGMFDLPENRSAR